MITLRALKIMTLAAVVFTAAVWALALFVESKIGHQGSCEVSNTCHHLTKAR